jgi:transcriptional regulator with XRE-family HTH domain
MPQVTTVEPDGPAIRDRRVYLGLTQRALSNAAGCSRAYVCAIENGKWPTVSKLVIGRIARVLETTPEQFIKTSGSDSEAA